MKKLLFSLLFIFSLTQTNAQQNLVLNPSFEEVSGTIQCNGSLPFTIFPFVNWKSGSLGTSDALSMTLPLNCYAHPLNSLQDGFGDQLPRTGNNYVGFASGQMNESREYVRGNLSQSLQVGAIYRVEFYICLGNYASYGMNNIGFSFINNSYPIYTNPTVIPLQPHYNYSGLPITDTNTWQLMAFDFVANSENLNAFLIGNFFSTSETSFQFIGTNGDGHTSYLLLEDVSVYRYDLAFDLITEICQGESLSLPETSIEGVTGTWSSPANNQQTTTYTFLPENQQYPPYVVTIIVKPNLVPEFDEIGPFCGEIPEFIELPTISNNGIEGTWSPAFNPTQTGTYTFTPNDTQCNESITKTIIIETTPIFDFIEPFCEPALNFSLPNVSTNGFTGVWSPVFNPYETTTYTFMSNSYCGLSKEMTIIISDKAEFDQIGPFCDIAEIENLPSISNNGIEGTWSPFFNPNITNTYTFTPNDGFCSEIVTMKVIVDKTPTFDPIEPFCEIDENFSLPTISTNGISGNWSPEFDPYNSQTYTFTRDSGDCTQKVSLNIFVSEDFKFDLVHYCEESQYYVEVKFKNIINQDNYKYVWKINGTEVINSNSKLILSKHANLLQNINIIEVLVTDVNGCTESNQVEVFGKYFCVIQKGISPNGDDLNEYLDLVSFGGVYLKIFNRYGSIVYEKSNYKNEWKGQSNGGEDLPSGTYFYQIQTNISEQFTGYIQLTY